ncbi:hypothetical protein [Flavobacterium sp.]|uniref:hypothetical protein n=1 Tax=Flavobacterium sp. TaxID=239 RepID=UPI0026283F20|nr:hypothetical protein [Flavobacterium sp.]
MTNKDQQQLGKTLWNIADDLRHELADLKGFSERNLEDAKLVSPINPKEQQKIASCFSSLDALITAQVEKIEQLKLHKKGLMQGLFPKSITN